MTWATLSRPVVSLSLAVFLCACLLPHGFQEHVRASRDLNALSRRAEHARDALDATAKGGGHDLAQLALPEPIEFERIQLVDTTPGGKNISYTDCMESSVLRFVQLLLCDTRSLDGNGVPTKVDLELMRSRVSDADVRAYFEQHPKILPTWHEYLEDEPGFEARQAWARVVTRKPYFTYKRSTTGVYLNDWLTGRPTVRDQKEWLLELEPSVHNVISVLRDMLGVDFTQEDRGPMPWVDGGEARHFDVSQAAQAHLNAAMRQLSRAGMELRARIHPHKYANGPPTYADGSPNFSVRICLAVNGRPSWRWVLTRRFLLVAPPLCDELSCPRDESGMPYLATSKHSHIEQHRRDRHEGAWVKFGYTPQGDVLTDEC